jgi:hypothetical protein
MFKHSQRDRSELDPLTPSGVTSRQIVGIIAATMLVVLLAPVGVRAAPQLTQMVINDATGTFKAGVDASGNLQVKSSQNGTWNVGASQNGTWNVGASQNGAWNVGVNNSSSNPVPVSGTVGIDTSSNTVQLGNPANSPGLVEDVGAPGRIAFQESVQLDFTAGDTHTANVILVPAGKRLVIEFVSAGWVIPSGQTIVQLSVETIFQGHDAFHFFAPVMTGSSTIGDWAALSQETSLYADHLSNPGGDVAINVYRSDSTGSGNGALTVSGYLIDCSGSVPCQS